MNFALIYQTNVEEVNKMSDMVGMSTGLSSAQFMQQYSVGVTKKAMDTTEVLAQNLVDMMKEAAPPPVAPKGNYIDVFV